MIRRLVYTQKPFSTFEIAAGGDTSLALKANGSTWAWGGNASGQVGDRSVVDEGVPNRICGAYKTFCDIWVGSAIPGHSLALDYLGRAWAWGEGGSGQLGRNSTTDFSTPVSVCGAVKTFCHIDGCATFSFGLTFRGGIWSWGAGTNGQLGRNSITNFSTPVSICGAAKTFCYVSAGNTMGGALDLRGRVWTWGAGTNGQLGVNSTTNFSTPVSILGAAKTFCVLATGGISNSAIDKDGKVWSWGAGTLGVLGRNSVTNFSTPVSVCGAAKTFCQLAMGYGTVNAIDKNGKVWGWGNGSYGQIGANSNSNFSTPVSICGAVKTFCKIAAGFGPQFGTTGNYQGFTYAIDYTGLLWGWGYGMYLGIGKFNKTCTPTQVYQNQVRFWSVISGGANGGCGITPNGRLWCWGNGANGILGNRAVLCQPSPVCVCGAIKTFCRISLGNTHTVSIDNNGKVWSWGSGVGGKLGRNSTTNSSTPVSICGAAKTFCEVAIGNAHTLGITNLGRIWAWGSNTTGALGDNTIVSKLTPVLVLGQTKTFCYISAGTDTSMGLEYNGDIWSWGTNTNGILGINSVVSTLTPRSVCGTLKTFCRISIGVSHSAAIDKYGKVWAWGLNTSGQLGRNSLTNYSTPISICGVNKTFCKITTANGTTAAIDQYGQMWTWGLNGNGQLGNNSITNYSTPISICGNKKTFCDVKASGSFFVGLDSNNVGWAWGQTSAAFPLGNSTVVYTPIRISYM
jgi:alpha-tubulin suppressor-like RCC1 family protein